MASSGLRTALGSKRPKARQGDSPVAIWFAKVARRRRQENPPAPASSSSIHTLERVVPARRAPSTRLDAKEMARLLVIYVQALSVKDDKTSIFATSWSQTSSRTSVSPGQVPHACPRDWRSRHVLDAVRPRVDFRRPQTLEEDGLSRATLGDCNNTAVARSADD